MAKVLVVDDSEIVRAIVSALFAERGHDVESAASPTEATSEAIAGRDVVLVDLSFGRAALDDLVARVKREAPRASLLLFSDKPDAILEQTALVMKAHGWVRKSTGPGLVDAVMAKLTAS